MERAEARRLQPHYIESFFHEAFRQLGGSARQREPRRYQVSHVPALIRNRDRVIGTSEPVLPRYERIVFEKPLVAPPGQPLAAFVCPGHPLLDAVIDLILERHRDLLKRGAVLVDERDHGTTPRVLFSIEHALQDAGVTRAGGRRVVSKRVLYVELDNDGVTRHLHYAPYLDYRPLADGEPAVDAFLERPECAWIGRDLEQAAQAYAVGDVVPKHLAEVRAARLALIDKTEAAVKDRLTKEISYWDHRAAQLALEEGAGKTGARLNSGEARRRADTLQRRLQKRLEELKRDAQISPRPPVVLGGLLVVPQGLVDKMAGRTTPSTGRPDDTQLAAARARAIVMETERRLGFEPTDREFRQARLRHREPGSGHRQAPVHRGQGTQERCRHGHRHEERDPVFAEQAGRLHPRPRPVRQRRRRHTARALRPAAVPAGTGLRGGERQLRAQGPAGQRGGPAVGRGGRFDRARHSHDATPGGPMPETKVTVPPCPFRRAGASLAARPGAVDAAPAHWSAGRDPGRRVRQADSRRTGRAGGRPRQPRLPPRPLRGRQGLRRPHPVQLHHRREQVLQGQPVLRPQQPQGHHAESALLGHLRLHGGGPRHRVRAGARQLGPGPGPGLVQRLQLAGRGQGLQPVRHPAAVRHARVRRPLVRDRHAHLSGGHAVQTPGELAGAGRHAEHGRAVVDLRRRRHADRGAAVPDRLPDHRAPGAAGRGDVLPAGVSESGGAAEPEPEPAEPHDGGCIAAGGASIPYEWYTNNDIASYEGFYASVFYSYFAGLGLDVVVEDSSSHGRLDMALRFNDNVYLFEFKVVELAPEGAAIAQLKARGYADKYRDRGEPIHLIGVEFSKEARNLAAFDVEQT